MQLLLRRSASACLVPGTLSCLGRVQVEGKRGGAALDRERYFSAPGGALWPPSGPSLPSFILFSLALVPQIPSVARRFEQGNYFALRFVAPLQLLVVERGVEAMLPPSYISSRILLPFNLSHGNQRRATDNASGIQLKHTQSRRGAGHYC